MQIVLGIRGGSCSKWPILGRPQLTAAIIGWQGQLRMHLHLAETIHLHKRATANAPQKATHDGGFRIGISVYHANHKPINSPCLRSDKQLKLTALLSGCPLATWRSFSRVLSPASPLSRKIVQLGVNVSASSPCARAPVTFPGRQLAII